jgi:hypothetical protein
MLPGFPKIESARARYNQRIILHLASQFAPAMKEIDQHIQFEGRMTKILRHDSTVGHSALDPVSAKVLVARIALADFTEEMLETKLKEFAEQIAQGQSAILYAEMERATTEVGNIVDSQGSPLSAELMLEAIEKMEHSFEPDGTWHPPTFLVHPEAFQRLKSSSAGNFDALGKRLNQILRKKRDDFRSREANRILAG